METTDFFRCRIDATINLRHPLAVLATRLPWSAIAQATNLLQDVPGKIKVVVADLGFRGVDADNPGKEIIHRGKFKSLNPQQKAWLRRRQAVEPAIGHLKSDHRMDPCWLKGALGDALHNISCAAGYNLRWLLHAIAKLGIAPAFLCLLQMVLLPAMALRLGQTGSSRAQFAARCMPELGVGASGSPAKARHGCRRWAQMDVAGPTT